MKKSFKYIGLLCFFLGYVFLMLPEYWGNQFYEHLLIIILAFWGKTAIKGKIVTGEKPRYLVSFTFPIILAAGAMILTYRISIKNSVFISRALSTLLFLIGLLYWIFFMIKNDTRLLVKMYSCAIAIHLFYLPLPIVTAMFCIPVEWIGVYIIGAVFTIVLSLYPIVFVFTPSNKFNF